MKRFFKSPWVIGIGTTVVGGVILSIVIDFIRKVSILSTAKIVVQSCWQFFLSFLNFKIKIWWLLIALVVILSIIIVIAKIKIVKNDKIRPPFLEYTHDDLLDYSWEWK